jgi:NTP pyrophosphatase (non-canonical NTP hydrolase)
MNLKKWRRPGVPVEVLALKLCEEAGEVANEITDGWKNGEINREAACEELRHTIAIAEILLDRFSV